MLYNLDKTSFKKAVDKIESIDGDNVYIKTEKGKFYICGYNIDLTLMCNVKTISSDEISKLIRISKFDFLNMFNSLSIIKKGIKDKMYTFTMTNENDCIFSVCVKDEIKEETVKQMLNISADEKWDRTTLVNKAEECIPSLSKTLKDNLHKTVNEGVEDKEDYCNKIFDVTSSVVPDYNTRSAKVQIEHYISVTVFGSNSKENEEIFTLSNDKPYFSCDIIQFKQIINFIKSTTTSETYVNGMNNICVYTNKDKLSFVSTDMYKVCKTDLKLNKECKEDSRIIIPKDFLLQFMSFNSEDSSVVAKGYIGETQILISDGEKVSIPQLVLQSESVIMICSKDKSLVDMQLDLVSKTFRMQNIKLSEDDIHKLVKECENIKILIKNVANTKVEEGAKGPKIKDFSSFKIAFEIVDDEVVNFKIDRSYERMMLNENMYVYNLAHFYSLLKSTFYVNYKQENFDILFDKLTKMAYLKIGNFDNQENYTTTAIFPIINEK